MSQLVALGGYALGYAVGEAVVEKTTGWLNGKGLHALPEVDPLDGVVSIVWETHRGTPDNRTERAVVFMDNVPGVRGSARVFRDDGNALFSAFLGDIVCDDPGSVCRLIQRLRPKWGEWSSITQTDGLDVLYQVRMVARPFDKELFAAVLGEMDSQVSQFAGLLRRQITR
jgi:hypothetical protein